MNKLRKILFPFSVLYDGVTTIRNWLYDKEYLESTSFDVPVICVGNLSVGGTGKTPMIEYLVYILKEEYKVAVLSRGYNRKTKGFRIVETNNSAEETGDEPLQFKRKYPDITVAVDGNRRRGIKNLEQDADVILLDDAFQHRKIKPSFTILLTTYSDLYYKDLLLPAGNLRESRSGAKRADIIVVTKCPENLPYSVQQKIQYDLKPESHQRVYFSAINYASVIQNDTATRPLDYLSDKKFTLVTGIANPAPLVEYLEVSGFKFDHLRYPDHHHFSEKDRKIIMDQELVLTTEKDFMRLNKDFKKESLYYLPIHTQFLNKENGFITRIVDAVKNPYTAKIKD